VTQKKGTLAQSGPHRQNGTHARVALRDALYSAIPGSSRAPGTPLAA